jgi:hypothetical protein
MPNFIEEVEKCVVSYAKGKNISFLFYKSLILSTKFGNNEYPVMEEFPSYLYTP